MIYGFQQHPDGDVYVRNGGAIYKDTFANFELDFGQVLPALPAGANQRLYEPAIRHPISGPDGVIDGGPMPWAFGDAAIAACEDILAAQVARQPPPETPSEPEPPDENLIGSMPLLVAAALNTRVADGDVQGTDNLFNVAGVLRFDVGTYMLILSPVLADGYTAIASGNAPVVDVVDKGEDYLMIETRDGIGGSLVDASCFSVNVYTV